MNKVMADTDRDMASGGALTVRTLGAFAMAVDGRAAVLPSRKSRAVVAYLALADERRETRERLVGLFWSEVDEAKARASLRQSAYEIREALASIGYQGFSADKTSLALGGPVAVDLLDVIDAARRGDVAPILLESEQLIERLLHEFESVDGGFHTWLLARRMSYAERIAAHLEDALKSSPAAAGEKIARALLRLDATHEVAARYLIRARATAGDVAGALGVYKALWEVLEREYDVEPSRETQELIAALRMDQHFAPAASPAPAQAAPSPAPGPPAPTRLVLSIGGFDVAPVREEHRYLVQGFRRELIACLVRFRELVIRDNAETPAGANVRDGGVGEFIVDASAFESSEGVRLLLMLRNARTNDYIWSERFQLSLESWFDAQQAIVRRLAAAMNVFISVGRTELATLTPTGDLIAYDLWLRGQSMIARFNYDDVQDSSRLMEEIIARAPSFAPAFSTLAQIKNSAHMGIPGLYRTPDVARSAIALAREAARLDPVDSRSQLCLGWALILAGQFEQGAIHHEAALGLNENDPWTMMSAALSAAFMGRREVADARVAKALEIAVDPGPTHWGYVCQVALFSGDYEAAAAAGLRAQTTCHFRGWAAIALALAGKADRARAMTRDFLDVAQRNWRGETPYSPLAAADWFLHAFPIQREADWNLVRDGLALAGAPYGRAVFSACVSSGR
jgi:DNA-binding SARP family transcriptional activator/TolB-like protein